MDDVFKMGPDSQHFPVFLLIPTDLSQAVRVDSLQWPSDCLLCFHPWPLSTLLNIAEGEVMLKWDMAHTTIALEVFHYK